MIEGNDNTFTDQFHNRKESLMTKQRNGTTTIQTGRAEMQYTAG